MNNMEKSELVIAKILTLLMEWGIKDSSLNFKKLELDDAYASFFFPCINWLSNEGIIRTGKIQMYANGPGQGSISNPVLTSYGISLLGNSVKVGNTDVRLSEAVKTLSAEKKSYSGIGDFMGGFLGGFTKSMGS
jgi:hypothetical protein